MANFKIRSKERNGRVVYPKIPFPQIGGTSSRPSGAKNQLMNIFKISGPRFTTVEPERARGKRNGAAVERTDVSGGGASGFESRHVKDVQLGHEFRHVVFTPKGGTHAKKDAAWEVTTVQSRGLGSH